MGRSEVGEGLNAAQWASEAETQQGELAQLTGREQQEVSVTEGRRVGDEP